MLVRLLPALASLLLALPACASGRADRPGGVAPGYAERSRASDVERAEEVSAPSAAAAEAPPAPASAPALAGAPRAPARRMQLARAEEPRRARPIEPVAGRGRPAEAVTAAAPEAARAPVLIYTAQLTMAIFEVAPALRSAEALARELGGFMARQTNSAIVIRVPVARFHEAITRLEKLGDITNRDISAEDVTQEFFDLEVRIKSARAVRERLEQLLNRASRVDESIAIERELERVVGEIERLEGRLKFLQDRALFSTISLTFAARPKELVAKDTFNLPFPWLEQLGLGRLLKLR
jgi:hypothetical protein